MMFERQRTIVEPVGLREFMSGLQRQVDATSVASRRRLHPYLGRFDRGGFAIKKRIGIPWDHFSPTCRGTVRQEPGQVRVSYRISRYTGAWFASWAYIALSFATMGAVTGFAARDIMGGGDLDTWLPMLLFCGMFAFGGLLLIFVLRFARTVADHDSAELESVIREAAAPDDLALPTDSDGDAFYRRADSF